MRTLDPDACYRALLARDARFDGLFFVGVLSTRIYCRPVCPVRPPLAKNCTFHPNAAAAEQAGFRPCLRCRPELAPGHAPMDAVGRLARAAATRIEAGALGLDGRLEDLAAEFGVCTRQLRRAIRQEYGVSPIQLAQTHRLLLAKRLLTETHLKLIDVAFASGFGSVRRFNHAFSARYGMPPSRIRKGQEPATPAETLTLNLAYRPPLDWPALLDFIGGRATLGVERIDGNAYLRTVAIGDARGWLRIRPGSRPNSLTVEMDASLAPVLPAVLGRLKSLLDLDARPDAIAEVLRRDDHLRPLVDARPGLRLPGAFDPFEVLIRAILGQQVSVRAATTLAGRVAGRYGRPVATPIDGLDRAFPDATTLADASIDDLRALGLMQARAACVLAVSEAVRDGSVTLGPSADPEATMARLRALPGIGEWTSHYAAMRILGWTDAFPHGDLGLKQALPSETPRSLLARAEAWRPWRAYAAMHVWRGLADRAMTPAIASAPADRSAGRGSPDPALPVDALYHSTGSPDP